MVRRPALDCTTWTLQKLQTFYGVPADQSAAFSRVRMGQWLLTKLHACSGCSGSASQHEDF